MSIDFEVPAEAKAIREKVRQWVQDECIPGGEGTGLQAARRSAGKLREKARAQGLWCPFVPKEYGGMGLGPLANALVQMELGESIARRAVDEHARPRRRFDDDDPGAWHRISEGKIPQAAVERRQADLLLDDGESLGRRCHRDADHAPYKDGNDNYILNGEKWFSSSASVADMALVMARTDPDAPRHKQYSTFIVELPNPGYRIKRNIKNMAIEGAHYDQLIHGGHSEIEIKDLKVPAENLLGGEGNGFNMGQHRLAYGRLRHGMHNIAKAQRALDMAAKRM